MYAVHKSVSSLFRMDYFQSGPVLWTMCPCFYKKRGVLVIGNFCLPEHFFATLNPRKQNWKMREHCTFSSVYSRTTRSCLRCTRRAFFSSFLCTPAPTCFPLEGRLHIEFNINNYELMEEEWDMFSIPKALVLYCVLKKNIDDLFFHWIRFTPASMGIKLAPFFKFNIRNSGPFFIWSGVYKACV